MNKQDYKGFVLHVQEWNRLGIPYGTNNLIDLAKQYNTKVPFT